MKPILFTQATCGQCKAVHMLFDKLGVEYEECQDVAAMKERGVQHTPALLLDGKLIVGPAIMKYAREHGKAS